MILLRHGQSEFNLHFATTRRDPGIIDPALTDHGHAQAHDLAHQLAQEGIRRIVTSPYTRALQTTAPIAKALGVPVLVRPVVRERFAFACDVGTARTDLQNAWPEHDFSAVDEIWWPAVEEPADAVVDRAATFRAELAARPDWSDTLVVSHWGFILCMTGQSVGNGHWLRCDPTLPAPERIVWRA